MAPISDAVHYDRVARRRTPVPDIDQQLAHLEFQNKVLLELALAQRQPATSLARSLRPIIECTHDYLAVKQAGVWLFCDSGAQLQCVVQCDENLELTESGHSFEGTEFPNYFASCRRGERIVASDSCNDNRLAELVHSYLIPHRVSSTIDLPLFVADEPRGVLRIEHGGAARTWSEAEELFSDSMAHLACLSIAAHERQEGARLVEALFNSASQAILIVKADGTITSANSMAAQLVGGEQRQLVGAAIETFLPTWAGIPDDEPALESRHHLLRRLDGSDLRASVMYSHIERRSERHQLIILNDVTERLRIQKALEEREALYRAVVEDQHDPLVRAKVGGQITFANRRARDMVGVGHEDDVSGFTIYDFVPSEDQSILRESAAKLCPSNPTATYEHRLASRDGSIMTLHVTLRGLFDEHGSLTGYQSIAQDVSKQKVQDARMREAQRMETIALFCSGIAHDFNNLLTPIIGYSEMLQMAGEKENTTTFIEQIRACADRAAELVRQMLSFSRSANDHETALVSVAPLVRETLQIARASIPASIDIAAHIDDDCGAIRAVPSDIYQILSNLMVNAYQAMPAGGALQVSSALLLEPDPRIAGPAGTLQIIVSDSGAGISEQILDKIFEPFFSTKSPKDGTGLGLTNVRELVEHLNGRIDVQSREGRGTSFAILLPAEVDRRTPPEAPEPQVDIRGSERLLVVDDDPSIATMLVDGLSRLGYPATARTSPNDALALVASQQAMFDCLVTDLTMPHMSGIEMARRVKQLLPRIRIVLISGFRDLVSDRDVPPFIDAFLAKPVGVEDVARAVRATHRD